MAKLCQLVGERPLTRTRSGARKFHGKGAEVPQTSLTGKTTVDRRLNEVEEQVSLGGDADEETHGSTTCPSKAATTDLKMPARGISMTHDRR